MIEWIKMTISYLAEIIVLIGIAILALDYGSSLLVGAIAVSFWLVNALFFQYLWICMLFMGVFI